MSDEILKLLSTMAEVSRFRACIMQNQKKDGEPAGPWQVRFNDGARIIVSPDESLTDVNVRANQYNTFIHDTVNKEQSDIKKVLGDILQTNHEDRGPLITEAIEWIPRISKSMSDPVIVQSSEEHIALLLDPSWAVYTKQVYIANQLETALSSLFSTERKEAFERIDAQIKQQLESSVSTQ